MFVDEEFQSANYKKTFADIHTVEEWWEWATGPMIKGLYPPSNVGNNMLLNSVETDYINGHLRVLGPIRMRQFRVENNSCDLRRRVERFGHRLDNKDHTCHKQYNKPSKNKILEIKN